MGCAECGKKVVAVEARLERLELARARAQADATELRASLELALQVIEDVQTLISSKVSTDVAPQGPVDVNSGADEGAEAVQLGERPGLSVRRGDNAAAPVYAGWGRAWSPAARLHDGSSDGPSDANAFRASPAKPPRRNWKPRRV